MENNGKRFAFFALAVVFALLTSLTAYSKSVNETKVKTIDSINVDGGNLNYSYTIRSRCPSRSHNSSILVATSSKQKVIKTFEVRITDSASEGKCRGASSDVTVFGTINLKSEIKAKTTEMINRGFKIDPDVAILLPLLRVSAFGSASAGAVHGTTYYGWTDQSNPSTVIDVVTVEYTPAWKCVLYKNDNTRNDGYQGTGATLEEARRSASINCKTTSNPNCELYSNAPDHTTCEPDFQESTKIVQYDSNKAPSGTTLNSWGCVLSRNEGLSRDTDSFSGIGQTETAARADAAAKCAATGNPRCSYYSTDNSHTACAQQSTVYGQKPTAVWNCSLWKNDGSRKDGFTGSGATEAEARRATIDGCQVTNNQYCSQYANDPSHTKCGASFVYSQ